MANDLRNLEHEIEDGVRVTYTATLDLESATVVQQCNVWLEGEWIGGYNCAQFWNPDLCIETTSFVYSSLEWLRTEYDITIVSMDAVNTTAITLADESSAVFRNSQLSSLQDVWPNQSQRHTGVLSTYKSLYAGV